MVASCFHRHCQLLCSAECRNKQRHQNGNQRFCLLNQIARIKIGTSRLLRLHNLIRFIQQCRNKAQCNRHHHCNFMRRHTNSFEGLQNIFDGICQLNGRCRQCQHRGTDNQKHQTDAHFRRQKYPLHCHPQKAHTQQNMLPLRHEQIDDHRKKNNNDNTLQTTCHKFKRHLRCPNCQPHAGNDKHIPHKGIYQKQSYNKNKGNHQLQPCVHLMNGRFRRIILTDCNISNHAFTCFTNFNKASLASSTV